ncbi:hypothetical protein [Nocardiopsis sp. NRRL B-16309]|uniref:hypothetical protein n=1 Tax=Nocardiopsis sp. NRRL B-16309 TaxID=1519494 RepID=UPI0006AF5553|nr:hypothetical protein [Nocardiopsis sp. NRRL B-16309]KOX23828.1 hypothetical protein ADL05_01870 [Nocardiopsis sp. NRRL B-16309]
MSTYLIEGFTPTPHTLTVEPAGYFPWSGERWYYELRCAERLIFAGDDIGGPTGASEDEMARAVTGFLSLRPGDTDDEYFSDYTPEQLEWCDENAEYLAGCLYDENGDEVADLSAYRTED